MWKLVLAAMVLTVAASTSAQAHQSHGKPSQCYSDKYEVFKHHPGQHAYYVTIKGKECWHIHPATVTKVEKPHEKIVTKQEKPEPPQLETNVKPKTAKPNEVILRGYLWLDCESGFFNVGSCYTDHQVIK